MKFKLAVLLVGCNFIINAQIKIDIDIKAINKKISPYLYGRNNSISSTNPTWTLPEADLIRYKDAGVTMFRECGGNNSTKYNWRKHLSSHPDWYNNVYTNNWDNSALTIQQNFPKAQGLYAFQLLGKVAKTDQYNFKDWDYNKSQWWEGVSQNLAGGGEVNTQGNKAKKEGDINLYLEDWPADSTTAIMNHWFDNNGLGLNKAQFQYWNMDNEVEIWNGTHDDVMPSLLSAENFMQKYFAVAKKARAIYPNIKLLGPVTANEWQWYNWGDGINYEGKKYNWLEFFIKRIAEEQKASGIKLLDVVDIHFYPETKNIDEITQLHRVFFDRNYVYPNANGVKKLNGDWDPSQNKEYIFARIQDWLTQYIGANHGVTLGITEIGIQDVSASATAVWYASTMGEFMKNGVELFTPWSWKNGMWETLHLFTKYNKSNIVKGESSNETTVSAYPTISNGNDSLTIVLVNKSQTQTQNTNINFSNFVASEKTVKTFTLKALPSTESFVSDSKNALQESTLDVLNNKISINLAPLSVTSIVVKGAEGQFAEPLATEPDLEKYITLSPNPNNGNFKIEWQIEGVQSFELLDILGNKIADKTNLTAKKSHTISKHLPAGIYFVNLKTATQTFSKKAIVK